MENINELKSLLLSWNRCPDEVLFEELIPKTERHSPYSNMVRARNILFQCMYRVKEQLAKAFIEHRHTVGFSVDFAIYLIPILESNSTIPKHLIPVLTILVIRHYAEFLSEQQES